MPDDVQHSAAKTSSAQHTFPGTWAGRSSPLLLFCLLGGCWLLAVADPVTTSRISNDTATAITVTVVLTVSRVGLEIPGPDDVAQRLRHFANGEGVAMVAIDTEHFTGTYRVAPSGFMIVHQAMGIRPDFDFNRLVLSKGGEELSLASPQEIARRFQRVRGYDYELRISRAF